MISTLSLWNLMTILLLPAAILAAPARTVQVTGDQIVQVKTALGIATIIQVPDAPTSVVLGDVSAFKVEYLDQAVTIKPLRANAESNLYIHTDGRRFSVRLSTTSKSAADYIVYLKPKSSEPKPSSHVVKWRPFLARGTGGTIDFRITRLGQSPDGFLFVKFQVTSKGRRTFDPASVWLRQGGSVRPIQGLYLSNLDLTPEKATTGLLSIRGIDLEQNVPAKLEIHSEKLITLSLPKATAWVR
jgi:hypothetical protein